MITIRTWFCLLLAACLLLALTACGNSAPETASETAAGTVTGTELKTAEDFLAFMEDKTIHDSDRSEMQAETCLNMFFNGEGICLGSGSIWVIDPNYMTDEAPRLEIIGLSDIVLR